MLKRPHQVRPAVLNLMQALVARYHEIDLRLKRGANGSTVGVAYHNIKDLQSTRPRAEIHTQ